MQRRAAQERAADRQEPARAAGNGRRSSPPLYQRVEEHLRGLIRSGKLIPGDLIPSEPQLARQLHVSQGTVKKAIDNLVWERLLFRHQGKGTYVSRIDFNNSLFRFFSYGDAEGKGVRIHKETTVRRLERGRPDVCRRLGVARSTELLFIERVGLVRRTPILVEHSWWPADVVPGLEDESVHIPDLLYALVVERYRVPIVRSEETLTAEAAGAETAEKLAIEPGAPVVVLKRVTYTTEDRVVEVRTTRGRADKFSYKAEIR